MFGFLRNISATELIVAVLFLLVIFGGKSVIDIAQKGGEAFKEIKKIEKNILDTIKEGEESENKQS